MAAQEPTASALTAEERAKLERVQLALRALLRREPLYARYLVEDDISILQCVYCDGGEEGDVFLHATACPWLRARALVTKGAGV